MSFNDLLRESQASEDSVRVSSGVSLSRSKTAFEISVTPQAKSGLLEWSSCRTRADVEYVRVLKLAAEIRPREPEIPENRIPEPDLPHYDALLGGAA